MASVAKLGRWRCSATRSPWWMAAARRGAGWGALRRRTRHPAAVSGAAAPCSCWGCTRRPSTAATAACSSLRQLLRQLLRHRRTTAPRWWARTQRLPGASCSLRLATCGITGRYDWSRPPHMLITAMCTCRQRWEVGEAAHHRNTAAVAVEGTALRVWHWLGGTGWQCTTAAARAGSDGASSVTSHRSGLCAAWG